MPKKPLKMTILFLVMTMVPAWSDSSPYGVNISELMAKSIDSNDSTYSTIAAYRCSALLALVNGIRERDSGIKDESDSSGELLKLGYYMTVDNLRKRGADVDMEDAAKRAKESYDRHYSKYYDWLESNYDTYGDYWVSDKDLQSEIIDCNTFSQETASQ